MGKDTTNKEEVQIVTVSPILIGILVIVLSLFGLVMSGVVKVDSSKIPGFSSIQQPEPASQINFTTNLVNVSTSNNIFDPLDWLGRIPASDLWNYLTSGTKALVGWITELISNLVVGGIHMIDPKVNVPSWLPTILFLLIVALFVFWAFDALWELGHKTVTIALIVLFVVFAIAIVLAWLNLLH